MLKQFYCPLHGTTEGVRVAQLTVTPAKILHVHLECLTCPDHLGTLISLPIEVMGDYDLPELGSNIYNPLKIALTKKDQ